MSQFLKDTGVISLAANRFGATLQPGWRIGAVPNGGYVLSIIGRVLSEALAHPDPVSINAFYLAPCELGDAEIDVTPLRETKNTSFASAALSQEGQLRVQVTAAFGRHSVGEGPSWCAENPPQVKPFAHTQRAAFNALEIHERVDMRMMKGQEAFMGQPSGSGEFVAWLQHRDETPIGVIDLLMFADIMPPPIFAVYGPFGWVPTVELTVQVRGHPAPGPLLVRVSSRYLSQGFIEADGELWDSEGCLVALSRQTMKVRLPQEGDASAALFTR